MAGELTPEQLKAEAAGRARLIWLRAALVGNDGRGLQEATGNPETTDFYPNQIMAIMGYDRLQATEKCRQIGHSFALAADSLARAVGESHTTASHISTDRWESRSKQGYVKRILESMNRAARAEIKLVSDTKDHIELETPKGHAQIDFLAQRPPRGAERAAVYLHEMAHMEHIRAILKGGVAATLHGGFIKGCSTHEGSDNDFNQIMTNAVDEDTGERRWRNWARYTFPWWLCPAFCVDMETAVVEAPTMDTEERLAKFAKPPIIEMRASSSYDDFREECECEVIDSRYAYFPYTLIDPCISETLVFEKLELNNRKDHVVSEACEKIDWLARRIWDKELRGQWAWSLDIGRYTNPDAIVIGHATEADPDNIQPNLIITMGELPFPKKQAIIAYLMDNIPVTVGYLDSTGMGTQLGEWAEEAYGQRAIKVDFTNELKALITNNLKIRMERRDAMGNPRLLLPQFGKLRKQIHSIRKKVGLSGKPIYDSESNGDNTHADMYWALALWNSCFGIPEPSYAFTPVVVKRQDSMFGSGSVAGQLGNGFGSGGFGSGRIWTPGKG